MRIVRLELIPIALPFRQTYRTANGELSARTMIVVRLHADSGEVGLGEAVPLSLRGGASLGQVGADLAACGPVLAGVELGSVVYGDPIETRAWVWELLRICRGLGAGPQAIAALDIALHDLAGRASGMPMWRLLGAGTVKSVRCNATLDAGEPAAVAETAAAHLSEGFTTYKVKAGTEDDAERIAAVREALGPRAEIRIDANGAWDPGEAMRMLLQLQQHSLELVEQPCPDLEGLAQLRAGASIPVIADESVATIEQAQAAAATGACDAATLKLAKVGGPLEALRIATVLPSYLSSALDGPIGIAAALHTAQALPSGGYASRFDHGLATLGMFERLYAPSEGLLAPKLEPPPAPGLGIEIDEAALEDLRIA